MTAVDDIGRETTSKVQFTPGIPMPQQADAVGGIVAHATTDRTPTWVIQGGVDDYHPTVDFECALVPVDDTPVYENCGSPPESSFTQPTDLPNGNYRLYSRARSGNQVTSPDITSFSVADWAPTYTATTSTTQAGAHPDLDFAITSNAGQLRSIDMLLPKGLIGSLNSFAKCPFEKIHTAYDCPANTQVGTVKTLIKIVGLSIRAVGEVYLTEPQYPGDAAGLTIYVHTALPEYYENVVIPLRLQLVNNSQYLRTFSDSIPVSTPYHVADEAYTANFFVKTFELHLDGSAGSPFPLLTNPSSCAAGNWDVDLGDTVDQHVAAPAPHQATGCETVPFDPTFAQDFTNPVAAQGTGVRAVVSAPEGNSSLDSIKVLEPPILTPNFPAFGTADDSARR